MSIRSARLVGGRYQLHTMLGRGGMAAVWAGVDTRLDRPVAVKLLDGTARADPAMVQRLDREARTVARLAHPNIVAVYDVGIEDGVPYLVMELVEGEDLQRRLARGPLDVRQAVGIAAQICDALEAAHEAGVVHRDIKPDNILLTRAASVKVCDFGIARLHQAAQVRATSSVAAVGTSEYMAPEQATGAPVDARTDLYALGCVLYTMLTGGPPFSGANPMHVLWQQVHEPPAPMPSRSPGIPADLEAVVTQLLAKNPADRPDRAGDVRARLARLPGIPAGPAGTYGTAAAAEPPPAAHARAAVVTRTRTMPAIDVTAGELPTRAGLRLGPAGIAAVAVGAAAVTALVVVAAFMAGQPSRQVAAPSTGPSAVSSLPTATATLAPAFATVNAVRAAIQTQVQAGELDPQGANDLADKLDDVDRYLASGETDKAAQKVNDLRDRLSELRRDNKITKSGYRAINTALSQLADALPQAGDGRGRN